MPVLPWKGNTEDLGITLENGNRELGKAKKVDHRQGTNTTIVAGVASPAR